MKKTDKRAAAAEQTPAARAPQTGKARRPADRRRLRKRQREAYRQALRAERLASGEGLFNRASQRIHGLFVHGLSNLRFSLSLRISANFARLLLGMLLHSLPLFALVFCLWQTPGLLQRDGAVADAVMAAQDPAALPPLPYADTVRVQVLSGIPPPQNWWQQVVEPHLGALRGLRLQGGHPILAFSRVYRWQGQEYRVETLHDLWGLCMMLLELTGALFVLDALRAANFLVAGRRLNRRVLQPIADITKHAQMLSENDLSLRLNVAGTKNELRDLAVVLNDMLDRIEVAYNGQKQFVSDASHELRTPIAVVQGYANLLERWGKDAPQVRDEAISAIVHETANMKDLVEKLLFLARHDKKTFQLKREHFELYELMEETIRETEMITANHRVETGELTHCILFADRNAIKQAIRILIDNAVKYTPEGGVIRLGCDRQAGAVSIYVRDSGVGIAPADLPNIFDRFYRADAARAGQTPGHGLGLSIAKIIVLSHGGKIRVTSKKGEGTTFHIVLPN